MSNKIESSTLGLRRRNERTNLTDPIRDRVLKAYYGGEDVKSISNRFGLAISAIYKIAHEEAAIRCYEEMNANAKSEEPSDTLVELANLRIENQRLKDHILNGIVNV